MRLEPQSYSNTTEKPSSFTIFSANGLSCPVSVSSVLPHV